MWHTNTPLTSDEFTGNDGVTYTFQVRAWDNAGNVSVWSTGITTTIDATAPESQVSAPANSQTADFDVTWSGLDATSGIVSYDVQYRDGDGAWTGWQTDTTAISATFSGQMRHSYHFQSRARDLAGLVEAWPIQPDASTSVGPLITKYYYHGGKRVAMRHGGVVQYLHGDHLGSTSLTTDENGGMVARQLYHPYGTTRYSEGTLATDFGFTGQRNVAGIGLMDYNARFYDPALGRFISADTIVPDLANPQSLNRYSYVYNNSLKYNDPSGHNPILGLMLIVAGVAMLNYVVPKISNYAEANDMGFWEAAAQSDRYIDTWEEIDVGATAAMKVPETVVGVYMVLTMGGDGLQQGGMYLDSPMAWNMGSSLQGAAGQWGAFWTGTRGSNDINAQLQTLADEAVQTIDDMGDAAFTDAQREALINNPNLRQAYRGSAIDVLFKELIANDPMVQHLNTAPPFRFMPDVVDPNTGQWWDLTKPWLWQGHLDKYAPVYGPNGSLIGYE